MFTWSATDSFSLRGGYQVAERAPNTAELFQGPSLLVVGFPPSDPCSFTTTAPWGNRSTNANRLAVQELCADIINNSDALAANDNTSAFGLPGSTQADTFARPGIPFFPLEIEVRAGNTQVKSEEAETWTLGFVFQGPGSLENFSASVDVYNIDIENAIAPVNSLFVYSKCFNADGASNPTLDYNDAGGYCKMIRRNVSTGERAEVDAPFVNTGNLSTTGLDLAINWTPSLGSGSLFINSLITVLDSYEIQDSVGSPIVDVKDTLAEGGQFKYKLTNTFGYNFGGGKANVALQWRHLPSIRDESAARNPNTNIQPVDSYDTFNLFSTYSINDRFHLRAGIDNLTDEEPLIVGTRLPGANGPTDVGDRNAEVTRPDYYDILGRRAYIGLQMQF
jgi:outer membrane receptor protein involved in Fe transport